MRTFTCYVPGTLRDRTLNSLVRFANKEMILNTIEASDPEDYANQFARQWRLGLSFLVVEPDIVIRRDVMEAADNCGCEYGCFPYAWTTNIGPALGCTWFKDTFIAKYPTAAREARISWRQFDVVLMRHVLARKYGEQPHVHLPPVEHLNEAKRLLPEADPAPMMEVPLW